MGIREAYKSIVIKIASTAADRPHCVWTIQALNAAQKYLQKMEGHKRLVHTQLSQLSSSQQAEPAEDTEEDLSHYHHEVQELEGRLQEASRQVCTSLSHVKLHLHHRVIDCRLTPVICDVSYECRARTHVLASQHKVAASLNDTVFQGHEQSNSAYYQLVYVYTEGREEGRS